MRNTLALVLASWRAASSYRLRLLLSFASLLGMVIPVYFVSHALQPVMAGSIAQEGGQYFGFLILGMATFVILPAATSTLPGEVGSGINTGTLEALLGTPARLPAILGGLVGFSVIWTALRAGVLLMAAWVLGAQLLWGQLLLALVILGLILLAYLPFGIISSAFVVAFRTPTPLSQGVLVLSALLGGVYYPTKVIPSWIQVVSDFVPLTYGLRALRGVFLQGQQLSQVLPDLLILGALTAALLAISWFAFLLALRYARRVGTLAQY